MHIIIRRIPQDEQRYETVGDWFYDEHEVLHIKASAETEDEAFLIALHEMVEVWLCARSGITQEQVDGFDFQWAAEHPEYPLNSNEEPGDDLRCPYRNEHRFAMLIEHLVARELGMQNYGEVR
jgi:hypothetical protein